MTRKSIKKYVRFFFCVCVYSIVGMVCLCLCVCLCCVWDCVYMYVCVHVHEREHAYICTHEYGDQRSMSGILLDSDPGHFFGTVGSQFHLHQLNIEPQRSTCHYLPYVGTTSMYPQNLPLAMVVGNQTQVLILAHQAPYPLSHLFSPLKIFFLLY